MVVSTGCTAHRQRALTLLSSARGPRRAIVIAVVALLFVVIPVAMAIGQTPDHQDHPEDDATPVPAQPLGERNPVIGIIAAVTILVVGAAGIFIYRIIKQGI